MRYLILFILLFPIATNSATIVSNHTDTPTLEDSIVARIYYTDSLGQSNRVLDSSKVQVVNAQGVVFQETIIGVTGRVFYVADGNNLHDTAWYWKAQVSDIDGAGLPGSYQLTIHSIGHGDGGVIHTTISKDFILIPQRLSEAFAASTLDSEQVYRQIIRFANDSAITADSLVIRLLDSLNLRGLALFAEAMYHEIALRSDSGVGYWTNTQRDSVIAALADAAIARKILSAVASGYNNPNTIGEIMYSLSPDSFITINELVDTLMEINPADTVTNKLFAQLLRFTYASSMKIDSIRWESGNTEGAYSKVTRGANSDMLEFGLGSSLIYYKIYYHENGYPGKPPDSVKTFRY